MPENNVPKLCYPFSTDTCNRPGCTCRRDKEDAVTQEDAAAASVGIPIEQRLAELDEWADRVTTTVSRLVGRVIGLEATLNTTSAEANRAHVRISGAEALLHEAKSWLSLCAHRLASETPKVGEPSRADILAVCSKIDRITNGDANAR